MKHVIHFYITKGETHYVAECVELAIVTQGKTLDELIANIHEATELHLSAIDPAKYDLIKSPLISVKSEFSQA